MPVVVAGGLYAGPAEEGLEVLAPLARLGTPLMDATAVTDYAASQASLDPLFPSGNRYFFKSQFLDDIDDDAAAALIGCGEDRPTPSCIVVVRTLGGAVARVGDEETAFAHRGARFNVSIDAGWTDPAMDAAAIGWARRGWDSLAPFATGGVYVNFAGLDEDADRDAVFGTHAARLDAIARTLRPGRHPHRGERPALRRSHEFEGSSGTAVPRTSTPSARSAGTSTSRRLGRPRSWPWWRVSRTGGSSAPRVWR